MLALIALAASSPAHAPSLSDPRLAGAVAASLGALLLIDGLWASSLGGGWRIVALSAAGIGAAAVVIGATGYMLNRWTAASAAAAACAVAGMFAVLPLMVAGIRAGKASRAAWFAGGALIAPWAVGAVAWAMGPASSTRGSIAELGAAIGLYVFAWTIVKGLLKVVGDIWDSRPPAAGPAAAVIASLRRPGWMIASLVAVALGLGDLLVRASGLSPGTQHLVAFLLGVGAIVLACLYFLAGAAILKLGGSVSLGAGVGVFLVAKATLLLMFPAFLAPGAVLAAGAAGVVTGLVARAIPASLAGLPEDAAELAPEPAGVPGDAASVAPDPAGLPQDQSPAAAE